MKHVLSHRAPSSAYPSAMQPSLWIVPRLAQPREDGGAPRRNYDLDEYLFHPMSEHNGIGDYFAPTQWPRFALF